MYEAAQVISECVHVESWWRSFSQLKGSDPGGLFRPAVCTGEISSHIYYLHVLDIKKEYAVYLTSEVTSIIYQF